MNRLSPSGSIAHRAWVRVFVSLSPRAHLVHLSVGARAGAAPASDPRHVLLDQVGPGAGRGVEAGTVACGEAGGEP